MGNRVNLILSGGGIKGIAYSGVFYAGEARGFGWGNIAGVSAGALAGAFAGAGYTSGEIYGIIDEFDFSALGSLDKAERSPIVSEYAELNNNEKMLDMENIREFLYFEGRSPDLRSQVSDDEMERGLFKTLIKYSKDGYLFDGDILEEWVYNTLKKRDIITFGDLKGGFKDKINPRGYKVRMTAVDASRRKTIILPDDMAFYGEDPDRLEVAKAVRMSTSIPFAFKPVEIHKKEGKETKTFSIVDGGVIDNFPIWLIQHNYRVPKVGFTLSPWKKKKESILNTPLNILKSMIFMSHDIGKSSSMKKIDFVGEINTGDIGFLDFNLEEEDKEFLFKSGKKTGLITFGSVRRKFYSPLGGLKNLVFRRLGI